MSLWLSSCPHLLSVTRDSWHTVSHTVHASAAKDVQTTILVLLVVFVILTMESLAFVNRVLVAAPAFSAVSTKQALNHALNFALKAAVLGLIRISKAATHSFRRMQYNAIIWGKIGFLPANQACRVWS